ncbi:MAG: glyoxalase/bleomycin resistance/extradiol dioxygenase family protein [Alphaproteobacteria bacterium]|nr:glyoxalase/bleomycin resistance/extradiol dioxygenase family protein [Alphaproteobacteria bacterium]MDE2042202.1 glyoxalase/bleomycin resistance/extradiol dioxygenase family protein [Alphaproteobacteria bacterium]MDE2341563.1 glyoxalase/bleomycin resistance/extradiol dioxygenase family protein [Alphaproteobacteria bacterium]
MPSDPDQGPSDGLTPHISIRDKRAKEAIDFYKAAFGAEEKSRHDAQDGMRLMHAHLIINGQSLILNDTFPEFVTDEWNDEPGALTLHLQVDDADAWFARAVKAGATVRMPLQDQFWGDRYGQVKDPFGFHWSIAHTLKT